MNRAWPANIAIAHSWQWASLLLPLTLFVGLAVHEASLAGPPPLDVRTTGADRRFGLPLQERQAIFADIASHDAEWRELAARFTDEWSQHDDYHIHVSRHVQALAAAKNLPLQAVFLIYDEGIRRHWSGPSGKPLEATWVPLKPRTQ